MVASKISETLIEFIQPLLDREPTAPTCEQLDSALRLAITAWNGVIMDDSKEEADYVAQTRKRLQIVPESVAIFDLLVDRKRKQYGSDRRMIGEFKLVERSDGVVNLQATAHEPPGGGSGIISPQF